MSKHIRNRFSALGLTAAILITGSGCDLGAVTPTPVAPTAVTATVTISAQATAGTQESTPTAQGGGIPSPTSPQTPVSGGAPPERYNIRFADYNLEPTSVNPSLEPYTVAPGLANVENAADFELSDGVKALIEQNAFAATFPAGEQYKQFYQLYEDGRYAEKPIFVTTDSVLHVYHLVFDKVLRSTETRYLIAEAETLTGSLAAAIRAQYDELKGTAAENAAKHNLAYISVAARLLDPTTDIPAEVQQEVSQELSLIDGHEGESPSPVMSMGGAEYIEDYGQYNPRGHYTRSEDLQRYFRGMMWYGRMTFRLKNLEETRSALLLTQALQSAPADGDRTAGDVWENIYEPTSFFVGGADDLTYRDYAPLAEKAIGSLMDAKAVIDDEAVKRFQESAKVLAEPRVNSMFVYITEDKEDATKGFRVMGQRFTLDQFVFGQLIWRNVGTTGNKRWLPRALDFPAALGSDEALEVLKQMGETNYANYNEQMQKTRDIVEKTPNSQWTENLYWSWLYTFRPLLETKAPGSGYPSFMTNDAWTRKSLNTVVGSWTELKHDTLLYAKQVMAEMGGGPDEMPKGYVEPEPEFYARIAALSAMTRDGLLSRGLIEKPAETDPGASRSEFNTLNEIENLALDLKRISEKELEGKELSEDEYRLIKFYGGRIEGITIASSDAANPEDTFAGDLNDQDAAIVADVATGLGQALTEATGRIMEIYVVVPAGDKLVLARGGIYSQYEFVQPSGNRLTNEQWRLRLEQGQAPELGDWKTFVSK